MSIPVELIDGMMVKCARRCCICRRFRPTKLQVHHIIQRNEGGSDDEDNLIVICFGCHTDVHTMVPFARRFSHDELKGHRNALVRAVEEGRFPPEDTDDADVLMQRMIGLAQSPKTVELSAAAVEILLKAVNGKGNRTGLVVVSQTNAGTSIYPGNSQALSDKEDRREEARYKQGLSELISYGLMIECSDSLIDVTYDGYLAADELAATVGSSATGRSLASRLG